MARPAIGFPPGLLDERPLRLAILANDGDLLALEKPPGLGLSAHPWYPEAPLLARALNEQAAAAKPELRRLGIGTEGPWPVFSFEPEIAGIALFAKTRPSAEHFRNVYGSELFALTFELLARAGPRDAEGAPLPFEVSLPVAPHRMEPRALISHSTGKRAVTRFAPAERFGEAILWRAETPLARLHQVRLHAQEAGLRVLGDILYGGDQPVLLSRLKRGYAFKRGEEEQPLYPFPCVRLSRIALGNEFLAEALPPPRWKTLAERLVKHHRER